MVSERSIFTFSGLLSWASYFRIIPFEWSLEELKLKPLRKIKYLIWNILHLINTWAHFIFLLISLVWNKNTLSLNPWSTALHLLWTLIFALTSVFITQILICRYELSGFANRFFGFLQNEGYTSSHKLDWCSMILRLFAVMADAFSICAMLTFYKIPDSTAYFYSIFEKYDSESFPSIYIFFGVWQAVNAALFCHTALFNAGIILIYWFSTYSWLEMACVTVDSGSRLKQTRFFGKNPLTTYKKIQLHNQEFNFCFRNVVLPSLLGAAILISISSYYCSIRFHNRIAILVTGFMISSACTIFICLACPVGAGLNYLSINLKRSLKFVSISSQNISSENSTSKILKSIRPIRIELGNFLYMQRITTLQLIGIIVFSTLKTLLLFRSNSGAKNT